MRKNFWLGRAEYSVCVLGSDLLGVCFLGCVCVWFGALSMLLKVTFDVVKSDVYHDAAALLGLRV